MSLRCISIGHLVMVVAWCKLGSLLPGRSRWVQGVSLQRDACSSCCLQLSFLYPHSLSPWGDFGTETPRCFHSSAYSTSKSICANSPQEQQFSYYALMPPVLSCVATSSPSPVRIKWKCATRELLSPHALTAATQPLPKVEAGGCCHSLHLCYRATAPKVSVPLGLSPALLPHDKRLSSFL